LTIYTIMCYTILNYGSLKSVCYGTLFESQRGFTAFAGLKQKSQTEHMKKTNKIVARIIATFSSPKKDIKPVLQKLEALQKEMEEIQKMPNKVQAIIRLFQVISPLQDTGGFNQTYSKLQEKNYGQLDKAITALESLQKHFKNAGRGAMNRTEVGEEVTAAKVFLGDVFGIWTHPASFWLQNQERFENEDSGVTPKPDCGREYIPVWYCINDYQAGGFVKSHVEGILNQIGILKQAFA
jgi:hypothetical protein